MSVLPITSLFSEVRVLTRDGVVPGPLADALSHRLEELDEPFQAMSVATMALLASARGQSSHARELFESLFWFDLRGVTTEVLECTFGWLVTDAAAEGDWKRVRWLLREAGHTQAFTDAAQPYVRLTPLAPDTVALRFFAGLAYRVLGDSKPAPQPHEDDRFRIPAEAQRFSAGFSGAAPPQPTVNAPTEPLAALLHALLQLKDGCSTETLESIALQLDEVLHSRPLRDRLMERATLLGGGDPDEALGELRTLGTSMLGRAMTKVRHAKAPLLRTLAAEQRSALIEEVDGRLDRLTDLCEAGSAPPMPEVWREFVAIRHRYERAVALSEADERGWPHQVALRLMRYFGTWLRLTMKERLFAHTVFTFLEVEALRAGDDKAAQLARASAELCLPFTSS